MFLGKTVLAIVPARSGSKGIPHKNMHTIAGISLIGWAGRCLDKLPWLDARIISTDSAEYAGEGRKYGLDAPFLRPPELSTDAAGAVETVTHALMEAESYYKKSFEVILIIEPTSPLRRPEDIEASAALLITAKADSVVTVSPLSSKFHPLKVLSIEDNHLGFYHEKGNSVVYRQSLNTLYWRNGICYALTRDCLLAKKEIFTDQTLPLLIEREIVNIDEQIELEWAEFLVGRDKKGV